MANCEGDSKNAGIAARLLKKYELVDSVMLPFP
jgi:hypothetical protein